MSYTTKIKDEITQIKNGKSETIAELSAYIRNNGNIKKNKIILTTENHCIVERVIEQIKDLFGIEIKEEIIENLNFSKKDLYQITIEKEKQNIFKKQEKEDEKGKF